MSGLRGASLPRLQEFAFIEFALAGVVAGRSYEEIRRDLIGYMQKTRDSDALTGNTARYQLDRPSQAAYADNTTEALKELMRLGLVARAALPSSGKAARHYHGTTFAATEAGVAFAALARDNWRAARDHLLGLLCDLHPQLAGYLSIVEKGALVVPLANWGQVREPRSRTAFLQLLSRHAAEVLQAESAGWVATAEEVAGFVRAYVDKLVAAANRRNRPEPFARNEDFVRQCEKAMVRMAFERAGTPTDYISHEVVRRWLRDLDVASFSYHVPGPQALRIWKAAELRGSGADLDIRRRNGPEFLDAVAAGLREGYELVRASSRPDIPWVPIYQLRAAVCYRLKVSERTFDAAVNDVLQDRRGRDLPFKVNVELFGFGSTPPTERPLRVHLKRGDRDVHTLALVPRGNPVTEEVQS